MSSSNASTAPEAPDTPATPVKQPSEKQMKLLAVIMQSVRGKPDIDWDNVVEMTELRNVKVAKEMYRQMQKKFGWDSPSGGTTTASPSSPSKVKKRVGKVGTKSTSKPASKGGGKKVSKQEGQDDKEAADEDDNVVVPKNGKAIVKDEDEDIEGV